MSARHRSRRLVALVPSALLVAILVAPVGPAAAFSPDAALAAHAPDVLLVGFVPGATGADRAAARASVRATGARPLSPLATTAERWTLPAGASLSTAMAALARNPRVRYAEPDWKVSKADTSNDPYYTGGSLWGMHGDGIASGANQYGTGADEAWAQGYTGSSGVFVGVIDEGIQYTHPDLAANIWTNPWEIAGNGIDDDGNGYIDDLHGYDFFNNDAGIYDPGYDSHGTHVSGTIGGIGGNGIGVAGVNWSVTIISGKFLGPSGGYISDAVRATDYLNDLKTRHGINLVATSNSWGGGGFSQSMLDAINRGGDRGILFVAAAGNSTSNNDTTANYPSNYQCMTTAAGAARGWDCVIAVAAIDSAGAIAYFSSYGATTVDLGAPGVGVYSSLPTDSYGSYSGTSMATPHVSGAVALCASINPSLTARQRKDAILGSAVTTASLVGKTVTNGRLDVGGMVAFCLPSVAPPSGSIGDLATGARTTTSVALSWSDTIANELQYEIQAAPGVVGTCGTFATVASASAGATAFVVPGLTSSTDYCFRIRGTNTYSGGSQTAWSNVAGARTQDPPASPTCTTTAIAWVDPAGGTNLGMSDDSTSVVTLPTGMSVMSYGQSYTQLMISSNGFVRYGSSSGSYYANGSIPATAEPNGIVAAAWDDWNPSAGGSVSWQVQGSAPNRTFVVTWSNVPSYNVTGSAVSFQVVFEEGTDAVRLQYLDMLTGSSGYDSGASATAGIDSPTGEYGRLISLNAPNLTDGKAYRCATPVGTAPTITTASLPAGTSGSSYGPLTVVATGGASPYSWAVAPGSSLPSGLTFSSVGVLGGTPSVTGTFSLSLQVTGADGSAATRVYSLPIAAPLAISTSALAGATAGSGYAGSVAATGGTTPYTWSATGTLPAGVTFGSTGAFSGTPTEAGSFPLSITVSDGAGRSATRALTLTVGFGKSSPLNSVRYPNTTTSVTLIWYPHLGATGYRWCASTTKTCTYTETTGTSVVLGVGRGQTWTWQVQANVSGTWVAANGGTSWKLSVAR